MNSPITASYPALRGSMFAGRGGCTVASYPGRSVAGRAHLTIASPALAVKSQTRRHSARTSRRRPSEYGHTTSRPNKLCVPASTPAPPAPPVENSPRAAGARHPPEPGSVRFHTNALRALARTIARPPRAGAHPSVCTRTCGQGAALGRGSAASAKQAQGAVRRTRTHSPRTAFR